ncbi:PREDICTED: B3 domain-containing protein At2g33720-like [Camelina sativa]|uniref:B3 domain-containing protein At2g33720-like n=1 Tax=Camelina sativa TaxID=90675 RepID=A0ABM0XS89_CAMSA|nr:PREDICTED: B3 domain-containing protein At2g33720-like [Camelina sativa]
MDKDMAPISASNKTLVTLDLFPYDKPHDDSEDASDNKQTEEDINLAPQCLNKSNSLHRSMDHQEGIDQKQVVEEGPGLAVNVYDEDTDTMHKLVLKKWPKCLSYILGSAWRREFVVRRDLKIGDVVGIYWDPYESKLHFCVLSRSPIKEVVEEGPGLAVNVYDEDTDTMHKLVLKKWPKCLSYILGSAWRREFVVRRDLKIGDVVGIYWDPYESKLHFSVLSRSPIQELI